MHNKNVFKQPLFRRKLMTAALAIGGTAHALGDITLEEVVVTATKRAESLQDVPISMLATSGEAISEQGISKLEDLTVNTPGVTVAQNPLSTFIFIRGVGTAGVNQGMEQSVGIYHDGLYMGRHQLARAPFMDLERVEFLRGPQSILFGKNTVGGAMSVITAKPENEFGAEIGGIYGSHGEKELTAMVTGPITDSIAGRISFRGFDMDGYLENSLTGDDGPEREDRSVRSWLTWDVTNDLTASVKYEASEFYQKGSHTQLFAVNPLNANASAIAALNELLVGEPVRFDEERAVINDGGARLGALMPAFNGVPGFPSKQEENDSDMQLFQVNIDWELENLTLTSITGYAEYEYLNICDCDFSALPLIEIEGAEDYEQFSQELRLTSATGGAIEYIAGLYWQTSDLAFKETPRVGSHLFDPMLPNVYFETDFEQESDTWALFGSLAWNWTESTGLTFGLRYGEEKKEVNHVLVKGFTEGWAFPFGTYGSTAQEYDRFEAEQPGVAALMDAKLWAGALGTYEHDIQGRKLDEEDLSWSLTLHHDLNEATMLYAKAATGFKGGGFDARFKKQSSEPSFEYDPEQAMTYEIGGKLNLLDDRMTLNLAVFYTEVDDYQVSLYDGQIGFLIRNAAVVESSGVEMDLRWAATEYLTVGASAQYLKAEYETFDNAPCTALQTQIAEDAAGGIPNQCINPASPFSVGQDASGETNVYSPEWGANLNFDYRRPLGDNLEVRGVLNVNYSDETYTATDFDPMSLQESYHKVDLRLSVADSDGTWELALIGRNLTNELTSALIDDWPLTRGSFFAQTDRPRSYAIQAKYRY